MTSRLKRNVLLAGVLLLGGIGLMNCDARGADNTNLAPAGHRYGAHREGWRHGEGLRGRFPGMMIFGRLELTVEQQHAIIDVVAKHKADLAQKRDQVHKARLALMQAMMQDSPDRQAIGANFDQASAARKQLLLARLQLRQDLRSVLTADQKAKLKEFRAKRFEHMQGRSGADMDDLEQLSAHMEN